jgi:hypothetical protein
VAVHARAVVTEHGFGMKVAVLPFFHAVFLTTYLNFIRSSPACSNEAKR